ncbi:Precursor of CEP14 [Linum grandiflorum]
MAPRASSATVFILLALLSSSFFLNAVESRKLLSNGGDSKEAASTVSSLFQSLLLMSSLPKGTVPASSPSKKGHSSVDNVERSERHLASVDRILRSVPSPGMGH